MDNLNPLIHEDHCDTVSACAGVMDFLSTTELPRDGSEGHSESGYMHVLMCVASALSYTAKQMKPAGVANGATSI